MRFFFIILIIQLSVNVQRGTCRCHIIAYSSSYHGVFRVDIQDIKHCSPNVPQYKCFYEIPFDRINKAVERKCST